MIDPDGAHRASGRCRLAALLVALSLAACSSLPPTTLASRGGELNAQAGHLILVTLENPHGPSRSEAGSTLHGYGRAGPYGAGDLARSIARELARTYHLRAVREWPIAPLKIDCLVFAAPDGADRGELIARLGRDPRVRTAQFLQRFATLATDSGASYNDPYFHLQRGLAVIHAAAAQRWSRGQGVRIAVIDTGADITHPDLAGRIAAFRNFIDQDARSFNADRHGTQVAGVIAAVANNRLGIVGVSPQSRLYVYKACQPLSAQGLAAECNSFTLALALSAAIEARVQIVNLSLAGPSDPLLRELIDAGERRGMMFVGAVPGDGRLDGFPLGVSGVIAVDDADQPVTSALVLRAPGHDVLSLAPGGRYDFATGSSFAAAQVTGALALLRAAAPHASAGQLFAALEQSRGDAPESVIDVCAALEHAAPQEPCSYARALPTVAHPVTR